METLSFNAMVLNKSHGNKDVLSVFKPVSEKNLTIHEGMSVSEISDIVSEKIIVSVKKQFEAIRSKIETSSK